MQQIQLTRPATPLIRVIAYWIATGIIVLETALGSEWDLARIQLVKDVLNHLGYPLYLLTILGIWKAAGAIVLSIPRFLRLKEWAYAGIFFVYVTAAASHFMVGDKSEPWSPLILALLAIVSWTLRPESRKWTVAAMASVPVSPTLGGTTRGRRITYWIVTILLAFFIISGGAAQLLGVRENVEGLARLGYPAFFVRILGSWKLLGGIAILLPRFRSTSLATATQLVKEWAYAGIVFAMSGAAASNIVSGMPSWHPMVNFVLLAFALISWAWRPMSIRVKTSAS
jgi:hypothetical protein